MMFRENFSNYFNTYVLDILPIIAIMCGIFVVITKNPIVSVLFLIGLFITVSCYLIILGASFLGLSYLLVYVGAISILFLFILMLINIRTSELSTQNNNSFSLAMIVIILFNNPISSNYQIYNNFQLDNYPKSILYFLYYVSSKIWDKNLCENLHITTLGNIIYTDFGILLIINSLVLLLAMVGAIVITLK